MVNKWIDKILGIVKHENAFQKLLNDFLILLIKVFTFSNSSAVGLNMKTVENISGTLYCRNVSKFSLGNGLFQAMDSRTFLE